MAIIRQLFFCTLFSEMTYPTACIECRLTFIESYAVYWHTHILKDNLLESVLGPLIVVGITVTFNVSILHEGNDWSLMQHALKNKGLKSCAPSNSRLIM